MQAMIFAAGLGTRLAPLTDNKPKALVNFLGKTMIENAAAKLVAEGCNRLIINVHHFADKMCEFIKTHDFNAEVLISDESDFLLDTGGGILKAQELLKNEENTILYNVDIASNIDINALYDFHKKNSCIATLAVKDRQSTRKLIFNDDNQLCGWKNYTSGEEKISRSFDSKLAKEYAFSGVSVISREIFSKITEQGKFSITNLFLRLAATEKIRGFLHSGFWADLGTKEKLEKAEKEFLALK